MLYDVDIEALACVLSSRYIMLCYAMLLYQLYTARKSKCFHHATSLRRSTNVWVDKIVDCIIITFLSGYSCFLSICTEANTVQTTKGHDVYSSTTIRSNSILPQSDSGGGISGIIILCQWVIRSVKTQEPEKTVSLTVRRYG